MEDRPVKTIIVSVQEQMRSVPAFSSRAGVEEYVRSSGKAVVEEEKLLLKVS